MATAVLATADDKLISTADGEIIFLYRFGDLLTGRMCVSVDEAQPQPGAVDLLATPAAVALLPLPGAVGLMPTTAAMAILPQPEAAVVECS